MKIQPGEAVIIILQNPREKVWGVLREINESGVFVRGIDLNSFEELVRSAKNRETIYGFSEQFLPLWRIERIVRDETDGDIPSMLEQFEQRTGLSLSEI